MYYNTNSFNSIKKGIRDMYWKPLDRETSNEIWNNTLLQFSDVCISQSFEWGEYRHEVSGAKPYRWIALDGAGDVVGVFQGLLIRRVLDFGIIVGEGGPVGDFDTCLVGLQKAIMSTLGLNKCYCRIYVKRPYEVKDALLLSTHNWRRALSTFSSGWSMSLDLTKTREVILSGLSRDWSRNLRRASNKGLKIERWGNADAAEIVSVYNAMESRKGLPQEYTELEIGALQKAFGDKLILYRCVDENGDTVALRGCLVIGKYGLDTLAAATSKGRTACASYALMWKIMQTCLEKGIEFYDLGGIDPFGNPGVYHFKNGTGAGKLEYLGEWDWATSEKLRVMMNLARWAQNVLRKRRKVKEAHDHK